MLLALEPLQYVFGLLSGVVVGLSLGLFGGGGSILAVPLLVGIVGVADTHIAIGTSALAVGVNALFGLLSHARQRTVNWRCAAVYAVPGVIFVSLGAQAGQLVNGQRLLLLFAGLMVVVALLMLRGKDDKPATEIECGVKTARRVVVFAMFTGSLSGFFGIGGGFLIVPGLMAATGMLMVNAVGTSLAVISTFGFVTAANYAVSGLVNWPLAAAFIVGGAFGAFGGSKLAFILSGHRKLSRMLFSGVILVVAASLILKSF